jgi:hypothetical protein
MRLSVAGLLAMSATGCFVQSALNPNDQVTLQGTAVKQDGSPLTEVMLDLKRSANSSCLGGTSSLMQVATSSTGEFTQKLTGSQTQIGDSARCFELVVPPTEKGARVWANFLIQVTDVKVPKLQLWTGDAAATQVAGGTSVSFTDLSTSHQLSGKSYAVDFLSGPAAFWRVDGASSPVVVSDEVLEDFATPTASLSSSNEVKGSGTTFTVFYKSDSAQLPSRQKVPVSRGASCTFPSAPTVCPLTDGKPGAVVLGQETKEIKLSLPAPKVIKKIVLRGAAFSATSSTWLDGSNDGITWTKLVDFGSTRSFQEVSIPGTPPAFSQFRITGTRSDNGAYVIYSLDELSLFEN